MQITKLRNSLFLLTSMVIAPISSASAQSEATQADLGCLVAIMQSAEQIDKVRPGSSAVAAMYYLGKVDADDPSLDLEAAIRDLIPKMSSKDVGAEDVRCGNKLRERGQAMNVIGQHLTNDPTGKGSDTTGANPH